MIYFLRLFPVFRQLEAKLRDEAGHRITADDKIRTLTAQIEFLEGKELAAKNETIDSLKHFVDFVARNVHGRTVFGSTVEEVQIGPKPEPSLRQTATMRTVVRQQTASFLAGEQLNEAQQLRDFYANNNS